MKTFVVGDIHGAYKALKQCLRRIKFDYDNDRLICLGDIVDGWPDTPKCIEELLKIKNLVFVLGNHDIWAMNWFETGARPLIWTEQGGQATIDAYIKSPELMIKHRSFFKNTRKYFVDEGNRIYVHGGFNP
jgi:serine/threonine protein phosphatase 1